MDLLRWFLDFVLHLDKHLVDLTAQYGTTTYAILFGIIFCETGLVVTPFLPGDSLLFAAGAVCSIPGSSINVVMLALALIVAAIIGDTVNYHIGKWIGPRVMKSETSMLFNKKHLVRTQKFFERHGGKTIIIARFAPIIRTFAPFVAGAGAMSYPRFIAYNIIGAIAWVTGFLGAGFFFGNIPVIKRNFTLVIFAIIFLSILPGIIEYLKSRRARETERASES
jgi:membrane-associated protein